MKVCFVASQLFAWGKYGGFGSLTRTLGREMAKRGVEVSAVVPRRSGQHSVEDLDGIINDLLELTATDPDRPCADNCAIEDWIDSEVEPDGKAGGGT